MPTILIAKNGRPYVKLPNGRTRFISNAQSGARPRVTTGHKGMNVKRHTKAKGDGRRKVMGGKRRIHHKRGMKGEGFWDDLLSIGKTVAPFVPLLL